MVEMRIYGCTVSDSAAKITNILGAKLRTFREFIDVHKTSEYKQTLKQKIIPGGMLLCEIITYLY